jgi:hypothetical protein
MTNLEKSLIVAACNIVTTMKGTDNIDAEYIEGCYTYVKDIIASEFKRNIDIDDIMSNPSEIIRLISEDENYEPIKIYAKSKIKEDYTSRIVGKYNITFNADTNRIVCITDLDKGDVVFNILTLDRLMGNKLNSLIMGILNTESLNDTNILMDLSKYINDGSSHNKLDDIFNHLTDYSPEQLEDLKTNYELELKNER